MSAPKDEAGSYRPLMPTIASYNDNSSSESNQIQGDADQPEVRMNAMKSISELQLPEHSEQIPLPEDVYGAVIYSVIYDSFELMTGKDFDKLDWKINAYRMFFCLLLLLSNYALQIGLTMSIYAYVAQPSMHRAQALYQRFHAEVFIDGEFVTDKWEDWDGANELCNIAFGNYWFMFMILCLWWLSMFLEVRKTELLYVHFSNLGNTSEPLEILDRVQDDKEEKVNLILNLMPAMRWFLYAVLLLPKMIIALSLLVTGTIWLASTDSFENVVLNSVALAFIVNIDELIFDGLVPATMKDNICMTKLVNIAVSKSEGHVVEVFRGYRDSTIMLVGIILGVGLYMSKWGQQIQGLGVFPGWIQDTDVACPTWWDRKRTEVCVQGTDCFKFG
jgi:hypothetical protein